MNCERMDPWLAHRWGALQVTAEWGMRQRSRLHGYEDRIAGDINFLLGWTIYLQ